MALRRYLAGLKLAIRGRPAAGELALCDLGVNRRQVERRIGDAD